MHVCVGAWWLEENTGSPRTRVTGGCELDSGPWQGQQVLLTTDLPSRPPYSYTDGTWEWWQGVGGSWDSIRSSGGSLAFKEIWADTCLLCLLCSSSAYYDTARKPSTEPGLRLPSFQKQKQNKLLFTNKSVIGILLQTKQVMNLK